MLNAASLKKLTKVNPDLVKVTERAAEISKQPFQIVQGNRTQAEQNALYAQGRTKPGPIVTWTKASKHIGGRAIDFAALVNNKINWGTTYYPGIAAAFKAAAKELGIGVEWGGDWKTKDWGHVQLTGKNTTPLKPTGGIGWTVADIQSSLLQHGVSPGDIDGILGPSTAAALKAFQAAHGLEQTGGPNPATLAALANKPLPATSIQPLLGAMPTTPRTKDARWAVDFLMTRGWTWPQAVALAANLVWESGGKYPDINWSAHGDKGKDGEYHSHGAPQWNDRPKYHRWQDYEEFARSAGRDWSDPEAQLTYLDKELNTTEKGAAKRLKLATTIKDAVAAALTFWRPSIPHADKRLAIAQKLDQEGHHVELDQKLV